MYVFFGFNMFKCTSGNAADHWPTPPTSPPHWHVVKSHTITTDRTRHHYTRVAVESPESSRAHTPGPETYLRAREKREE